MDITLMTNQWDPAGIFEVLACKESRRILAAASVQPVSAKKLEEVCDASLPTIYRRLNVLVEYDLLSEQHSISSDEEQSKRYSTALQAVNIEITDGGVNVNLEIKKDTVDKFGELFRDLGEGHSHQMSSTQSEFSFKLVPQE